MAGHHCKVVEVETHFHYPLLVQHVLLCFHCCTFARLEILGTQIFLEGRASLEAEKIASWLINRAEGSRFLFG